MSILNILVEREHALIGVDTEAVGPDGTRIQVSKVLPLIHLNCVLAGRGNIFPILLGLSMLSQRKDFDFDSFVDGIPGLLASFELKESRQAIAVVCFSPRQNRMVGRVWDRQNLANGFVAQDIDGYYNGPFDSSFGDMANFDSPAGMIPLARAQKKLIEEKEPSAAVGGRLIAVEITRRGIWIEPVCTL